MTSEVRTLPIEMKCVEAWKTFSEEGLRRAPVERNGGVIGMVTDRDLMRVLPWTMHSLERDDAQRKLETTLGQVVRRDLISVEPGDHLETAAKLMLDNKVGGLPVMQAGRLQGIITESDLFRVFVKLKQRTGAVRLTLHWSAGMQDMPDPARLALATGVVIREHFRYESPAGGELVGLRLSSGDVDEFVARLLSSGFLLIDREDFEAAGA